MNIDKTKSEIKMFDFITIKINLFNKRRLKKLISGFPFSFLDILLQAIYFGNKRIESGLSEEQKVNISGRTGGVNLGVGQGKVAFFWILINNF